MLETVNELIVGTDYSGLGAPEQALKDEGIKFKTAFACDKDKFVKASYLANHECDIFYDDVTTRDNSTAPKVDMYVFGFPCQAFSLSGKRLGFLDTRGTLFWNSLDYLTQKKPRYFIAENVKGLLSHDKVKGSKAKFGNTFTTIINALALTVNGQMNMFKYSDCLNYHIKYQVLNTKHYSLPQNRERIFIIGFRDEADAVAFHFPKKENLNLRLKHLLEPLVDEKYYLSNLAFEYITKPFRIAKKFTQIDGEIGLCLTAKSQANWTGDFISSPSDKVDKTGFINQDTQASSVYSIESVPPTLSAGTHGYAQGYLLEPYCAAIRGRNPDNPSDRTPGVKTEQRLEKNSQGTTNTITTVQKDNDIVFPELKQIASIYDNNADAGRVNSSDGLSRTIKAEGGGGGAKTGLYEINYRIRKLTPMETFRLQGFPDSFFKKCQEVNSDSQLYKQAGNSMSTTVLRAIYRNLFKNLKK